MSANRGTKKKESNDTGKVGSWFNPIVSEIEKNEYISLAHQLCYPKEVLDAIIKAKTDFECERILKSARRKY